MLIVPMIFEIMLASKMVMRYVDTGSIANLLSTPNLIKKIIIIQMISIIINISVLTLHLVISGITVFAACFFNDSKGFLAFGAGIPFGFYLIQMLSNMVGKLNWLKYFTIYTLFPGEDVELGGSGVISSNIMMITIATILYIWAGVIFAKKDFQL